MDLFKKHFFRGLLASIGFFLISLNLSADPRLKKITELQNIQQILIEDDWTGLSPMAPVIRHAQLSPVSQEFTGQIHYEIAGYSKNKKTKDAALKIPNEVVQDFLNQLSQAKPKKGEYKPKIDHTDDYPSLKIEVELKNHERIQFFSRSQGEFARPWGAKIDNQEFVVDSRVPAEALLKLMPYLKTEVLEEITKEAQQAPK